MGTGEAFIGARPVWVVEPEPWKFVDLKGEWIVPGKSARISGLAMHLAGLKPGFTLPGWRVERNDNEDSVTATRV